MARQTLAEVAEDLLRQHPARTSAQIGAEAAARRVTRAKDPAASVRRALNFNTRFLPVAEDGWVLAERVAAFPVTHRITPEEAASGTLAIGLDLGTLSQLRGSLEASDGTPFQLLEGKTAYLATGVDASVALRGPAGWPGFAAGTLVAVTARGGTVEVHEVAEPGAGDRLRARALVARARAALERADDEPADGRFIGADEALAEFIAADDAADARALPPLSEVFAGSDLETHDAWIGLPGTDWARVDTVVAHIRRWAREDRLDDEDDELETPGFDDRILDELTVIHRLDDTEAQALGVTLDLFVIWDVPGADGTRPSDSTSMGRTVADLTGTPRVALALADYALTDPRFEPFAADLLAATTGRREAAGPAYLLGAIAEARGEHDLAERRFRESLAADRGHPLPDLGLLGYEIDRGQYDAALARMRRLGFPHDEPDYAWVASLASPALPKVGRNDPCPCGSGRKFKACHLDRPATAAAVDPVMALRTKVSRFMRAPEAHRAMEDLVHEALGFQSEEDHEEPWFETAESQLLDANPDAVLEILLGERGWLRRFLDLRGALLPDAERALAEAWTTVPLSLVEVVSARPDSGLVVRDVVADGPPVDLPDRSLSRSLQPLDLAVLRLRPDGRGGISASNAIFVPRLRRAAVSRLVADGDVLGILRSFALPDPLPQLRNTDGEPIVFVTATYRVPDPAAAGKALASVLEEGPPGQFTASVERSGRTWIRGTIRLAGSVATVQADSRKRAEALALTLLGAAPGAELVDRREEQIQDVPTGTEAEADPAAEAPDGDPRGDLQELAEVQAVLDDFMRQSERAWVDESIPALRGRTPRQAIRTAAGRREVEALLDDMAWMRRRAGDRSAGLMDPDRIRELLGLPPRPAG